MVKHPRKQLVIIIPCRKLEEHRVLLESNKVVIEWHHDELSVTIHTTSSVGGQVGEASPTLYLHPPFSTSTRLVLKNVFALQRLPFSEAEATGLSEWRMHASCTQQLQGEKADMAIGVPVNSVRST
ncbi:unnamed protein product [Musa hybrid cultivar]